MTLAGKVAAVTGGGSGIGEATCIRLAADGARVAVIDLDEGAAELTAKLAGEGLAVVADVSDSAQVDAALATVEAELGPVDIWVNNAGISGGAHSAASTRAPKRQLAQLAAGEAVDGARGRPRCATRSGARCSPSTSTARSTALAPRPAR